MAQMSSWHDDSTNVKTKITNNIEMCKPLKNMKGFSKEKEYTFNCSKLITVLLPTPANGNGRHINKTEYKKKFSYSSTIKCLPIMPLFSRNPDSCQSNET